MKPRLLASVVLTALAAVALGGCARPAVQAPAQPSPLATVEPAPLVLMTAQQKAAKIAPSFPPQVPVPVGDVRGGEAQGSSAWDYELVVPGDVNAVMRWYLDAYSSAEWTATSRTATELTLTKNSAQSRLQFESAGTNPQRTRVTASVGVGTNVLTTQ